MDVARRASKRPLEDGGHNSTDKRRRYTGIRDDDILRLEAVMDASRAYESSVNMDRSGLTKVNEIVLRAAMENRVSYARRLAIFENSPWVHNDLVGHSIMHQVLRILGMIQQVGRPDHLELEFAKCKGFIRMEADSETWTSPMQVKGNTGLVNVVDLDLNNVRYAPIFETSPRDYKQLITTRVNAAGAGGSSDFPIVAYHCHPAYSRTGEQMRFYPQPVDFDRFLEQNRPITEGFDTFVWNEQDLYHDDNGVVRYTQERTDSALRTRENLDRLIEKRDRIRNEVLGSRVTFKPKKTLDDLYPRRLQALRVLHEKVRTYSVPLTVTKSTDMESSRAFNEWSRNALRFMFELEEFQPFSEIVSRRAANIRSRWLILCQSASAYLEKVIRACPRQCFEYVWIGARDEFLLKLINDITSKYPDLKDKFSLGFLGASDSGLLGVSYKDMPCVQSSSTISMCTAMYLDCLVFFEALGDCALGKRTALVQAVRTQLIRPDGDDSRARDGSSIAIGNGGMDYGHGFGASSESTTTKSRPVVSRGNTTLPTQGFGVTTTTPTDVDRVLGFTFGKEIHGLRPGATGNSTVTIDAHRSGDLSDKELIDMMEQQKRRPASASGSPSEPAVVIPHDASDTSGNAQRAQSQIPVNVVGDAERVIMVDGRDGNAMDFRNTDQVDGRGEEDFIPPNERGNDAVLHLNGHLETRASVPVRFNEKREPLARLARYHGSGGPTGWPAAPPVVNMQGVRLINFTQYYNQIHHTVTEQVYTAPSVIGNLDDWITSPILGDIPWQGYDNTYGDAGKGIRVFKFEVVMIVARRDDGSIDMTGLRLDGAYNHDVKTDNVIDIRRELLRHEITGDVVLDPETGRPVQRVDPDTDSYLNVFTDIGGLHSDDGKGARTGFKTYIDSEHPRALGESVAFQEEKGQPNIRVHLPKENLVEMDMPQYSVKLVGGEEGILVANAIEIAGGLTTSARDAIHETLGIPTSITPTKHYIRGEGTDLPVHATGNLVTEAMGIVGTSISGVLRIDGSSRTRQPAPIQVGGQIIPQEVRNINLGYQGSTGSSVFKHGAVELRVVGWVLPEASFVWMEESTDEFEFGKVYVQGTNGGNLGMKELFVYGDYNFCGRLFTQQPGDAPVMRVEVLRSLNRYDAPFTVMFDEYVKLGATERSVRWKHSGVVKKITQERQKVTHTVPVLDEEGAPTGATTTVDYEGLTNRLLVSYFPVPAYDKGPDISGGFFSCEWFHAAAVQGAVFWTRDRFSGNGGLDDESVAAMEGLMNEE